MDYETTDREPTMTDIKARIDQLNTDINKLATIKPSTDKWNIAIMKKPMLIKKFNSNTYSSIEKPFQQGVDQGWWGNSAPPPPASPNWSHYGVNMFPSDVAWWIGNLPLQNSPTASISYGSNDGTKSYFYYLYNAPSAMQVYLYAVLPSAIGLKINGVGKMMIPFNGEWFYGCSLSVNLQTGKNVFEITSSTGLPNSGFVFYAATSDRSTVLFKSGPGWGVSISPVSDYTMIVDDIDTIQKTKKETNENIYLQIKNIETLIGNVSPKIIENNTIKDKNIARLLAKLAESKAIYEALVEEAKIPNYFEDSKEVANIQANSNFNKYVWYLIFFIVFFVSFILVLKKPEAGNLDMFMLILGISILIYHVYEYFVMKQRTK